MAEPLPVTWGVRWKFIRLLLPALILFTILSVETVLLSLWEQDRLNLTSLGLAFLIPIIMLVGLLVVHETTMRNSQQSNRWLHVLEQGISLRAAARPVIRWRKIVAFWFEDISGETQFSKLTVEYFGGRNTKLTRRYSLVLDRYTQCPAVVSELKLLQEQHGLSYRIELGRSPPARPKSRNLVLGMSLYVAGALLLMHGAPQLLVPLLDISGESQQSESDNRWSPKQREKFQDFIRAHFSSRAELKNFMLVSGGVLSTVGIALMVFGTVVQRPKKDGHQVGPGGN